ncbi:MAG: hypothetical protein K9W45_12525 [Candidatus Heimdallarchaeum aukensis]|uniref:Uncharacterized protein n=1 Tax=Candidatus Heimdallarchaeum aukensis TaxID=2876573 RepID=A0A9Y1FL63_9ARCH|nr:MAG: hypothetical protein K9W45_12525 [Candidatus Heimdallarchaeum aukensis]
MSNIFLKLISSDFAGEEREKVEYSAIVGFALDHFNKGEQLEGIYMCYLPFFGIRVNESNFAIINALDKGKNQLSVNKIPDSSDIKKILSSDISIQEKYKQIESKLLRKNVETIEVNGILNRDGIQGLAKLLPQHTGTADNNYKKLSPIISREEVTNQIRKLQNYILSDIEVEERINAFLEDLEIAITKEIEKLKKERVNTEKKYDEKIAKKKAEIQQKLKEMEVEEKAEHAKIDKEVAKNQANVIKSLQSDTRWKQYENDIKTLASNYTKFLAKINAAKDETDLEQLVREIDNLQQDVQSIGVGLNSALSEVKNRHLEYGDYEQQGAVDKRNISERLESLREEERTAYNSIENEKETALQDIDREINDAKSILKDLKNKKKDLKKQIMQNYEMRGTDFTLNADVLGVESSVNSMNIYVPLAIARYKYKNKLGHIVIPPFEIANNMSKPKKLALVGINGNIGFDCIGISLLSKVKRNLEYLLDENQNLQNEIIGNNNEVIETGDLNKINDGVELLEQKKKWKDKHSDKIILQYRKVRSSRA